MIRVPLRAILRVLAILFVAVVLYFAVTFVQIWMRGHEHTTMSAQAILSLAPLRTTACPHRS